MKRLVTLFMAIALVLTLSISVFAQTPKTEITFDKTGDYVGYQLMTVKVAVKSGDTCQDGAHNKDCYTYSYKVNDKYAALVSLADIEGLDEVGMQAKANEIYNAILALNNDDDATNNITPELADFSGTTTSVEQGYWLFADVTDSNDKEQANSLVMVKTAGEIALNIETKTALPTINKYVKDVNDSTGEESDWIKFADYDMGDNVPFQLVATIHKDFKSYNEYKLVFEDTLDQGLKFNADSITVKVYAEKDGAELTLKDTDYRVVSGENAFTVTFADIKNIDNITEKAVFEVTYDAELLDDTKVEVGGYNNKVTLKFSNDPYNTESLGKMESDAKVYTYKLKINKVDENNVALNGAGFTLYKFDKTKGEYVAVGAEIKHLDASVFEWFGLDDGNYKLVETTVPDGYNKMGDLEFTIDATITVDEGVTALISEELKKDVVNLEFSETVKNLSGTILPETGGMGTMWLIFGGSMLVILAAVFMIVRKKMSIYQD